MISPDLSAPPPAPARGAARSAAGPAPERAFESFVEPESGAGPDAETLEPDPAALLEAAPPASPAAAPLLAAALALSAADPADAAAAEPDATAEAAPATDAARPAPPPAAAPAVAALRPPPPAARAEGGDGAVGEPAPEADAEPEASPRAQGAAPPAPPGAESRPPAAAAPPPGFDLALQPPGAQSWRLSAVAADAAQTDRAPTAAPAPREVATQITVAILQATRPQLEIRLDPPELGRVQIRLNPTEHGMQALVTADRPETQDFLRRHAETLLRDLTEAGYANVSLDFAAGGDAAPGDPRPDERRLDVAPAAAAAPAPAREPPQRVAAGGLDIRL